MRNSKALVLFISALFSISVTGISHADALSNPGVNLSSANDNLTIRHSEGADSLDLRNLEDGKTHRVRMSDGSYRSVTGISEKDNQRVTLLAVAENENFKLFTPMKSGAYLTVDGFEATDLIDKEGNVDLVLNQNVSHKFDYKSESPIPQQVDEVGGVKSNSNLMQLSILSITTQPVPLIIAPEPVAYTRIRYQTFIAERLVPVPLVGCSAAWVPGADLYFQGNERSWSAGSTKNKTSFDLHLNWLTGKIDTVSRSVGKTQVVRVFRSTGAEALGESATASSSSMSATLSGVQSANEITFEMRQDVSNPLCFAQGIYYDVVISVKKSGSYVLSGVVRKVPNHELYIRDSNSVSWTTVYRYTNVGFNCLTPGALCNDETFKSGTIQ